MKRQTITTPATQGYYEHLHFAPATRVGDTIWVSGQTTRTAADGIEAQARLAFEGIKHVLVAAGATMADIVEITTFHTDMHRDAAGFAKVKDEYLPDNFPAWTGVGVTALALPELLVEIRVVAVAGSGSN
jgi:enamine deaminase RidA (YjgF/YER057c/UK114 family)